MPYQPDGFPPVPPLELIQRVTPEFDADQPEPAERHFHHAAWRSLVALERALAAVGRRMEEFERLLDFGCGPGRTMRLMEPLAGKVELHGLDIDADAIAWCTGAIPFARFQTTPHVPPTPYPDAYFDLVVNHSVFTHLPEDRQDQWLAELRRIARPGAILLLTVHSGPQLQSALDALAVAGGDAAGAAAALARDGILFFDQDGYIGSSHPDFYRTTFHAPWYLFEHWQRFFEIRAYLPLGADTQDMVVLERRADGADPTPQAPARRAETAATPEPGRSGDTVARLLDAITSLHERFATPQPAPAPLGRLKRRALRGEIDRSERLFAETVTVLQRLAEHVASEGTQRRRLTVMHQAMQNQGNRISHLARELREAREPTR
jgi:SAM-dependent methyltransferase